MRKIKIFIHYIILACILSSCSGLSDVPKVLRNEKIKTTDEFLVEKREPLTEPPDMKKLPVPGSSSEKEVKEEGIKNILKIEEKKDNKNKNKSSSLEDDIIRQIYK